MVTPNTTISGWGGILVLGLILTFGSGCALSAKQKSAINQFSDSAATLGDVTSSELATMRSGAIKMTIERLLLGGKSKDPNLGDQATLDRGFELNRMESVVGATRALAAYGKTLTALVDDTQSEELNAASQEFVASLGQISEAQKRLTDEQLEAIGAAVQEVGTFWVDWKRKRAVTTVITHSQQAVDNLCDLLIRDFDPQKGWVALQLQVIENPLLAESTNALYDGVTYYEREVALGAFRLAHGSKMRRTEVLTRIVNAAVAMKQANAVIINAIDQPGWSTQDIRAFAERAQSLKNVANLIVTD